MTYNCGKIQYDHIYHLDKEQVQSNNDLPKPDFIPEPKNYLLKRIDSVFDSATLENLRNLIHQLPFEKPANERRAALFNRGAFKVCFDKEGQLKEKELIATEFTSAPEIIQAALKIGLQRMATELGWKDREQNISTSIIQYELPVGETINPIPWHGDEYTKHSLVILLDDPNGDSCGWEGGQFLYRGALGYSIKSISTLTEKFFKKEISDKEFKQAQINADSPVFSVNTKLNTAVLFDNGWDIEKDHGHTMCHTIAPLKAWAKDEKTKTVTRTIFSLFQTCIPREMEKSV